MTERRQWRTVAGWGHTRARSAEVVEQPTSVRREILTAGGRGLIARGLGRSYGDSAVNGGGRLLRLADTVCIDPHTGIAHCSGGASLDTVYRAAVPLGWTLPVTPGTRQVTVGGAIAADVHGKNHHRAGTFSRHVVELALVDGTGTPQILQPGDPRFAATAGGMGLTGVITEAAIQLERSHGGHIEETVTRCATFDTLLTAMLDADDAEFSVAWVDLSRRSCRGVLGTGRWVADTRVDAPAATRLAVPFRAGNLVRPASVAAFNTLWWARAQPGTHQVPYDRYFHPLDGIGAWWRLYGSPGFIQYQFVVPDEAIDTLREIVADMVRARLGTPMVVLKRFGAAGDGLLSFPRPGWTLAVDIAAGVDGLAGRLRRWDEQVAAAGGCVYLAKDAHLERDMLEAMYPNLAAFEAVQATMDPDGRFSSEQARRLRLGTGGRSA